MATTDYFEKLVLDHALLGTSFSISDWYVGLWKTDPTAAGSLAGEVDAGDYERKAISFDSSHANDALIAWDAAASDWGSVSWVCLLNSSLKGKGNMLIYEERATLVIVSGTPVRIPVGGLTVSLI